MVLPFGEATQLCESNNEFRINTWIWAFVDHYFHISHTFVYTILQRKKIFPCISCYSPSSGSDYQLNNFKHLKIELMYLSSDFT